MEIVRNLWRRRLRSVLTVTGIVMGIFALTTMGALAEHMNALLGGGITYYGNSIQISDDKGGSMGMGGLVPESAVKKVAAVDGVEAAAPVVMVGAKPGSVTTVSFGVPDYIMNWDEATTRYTAFPINLASGRWPADGALREVTLGSSMASEFNKKTGDTIDLPIRPAEPTPGFTNHTFRVVGIVERTLTAPDSGAFVSLTDAQTLLGESLPLTVRSSVDPHSLLTGIVAYGKPGANLDTVAQRINDTVTGVKAAKPSEVVASFKAGGALFTFMTTAAALLALIIGGLSVVNTMIMAVTERVREIGLKKAIGATTGNILREFLAEATAIGILGGVIGFGLGLLLTVVLNSGDPSGGLFLVTPRLALIALAFAVALGAGAGALPAWRAARMDPVTALRAQ